MRARESGRPDRLFDDPYAAAFASADPQSDDDPLADDSAPASPQRKALAFHVVIRTRYYDDYLQTAVADGIRQVVLLAAGLDTRAFRLAWPDGTRLFELDLPELLEVKERVLGDVGARPTCERAVVPADLRSDWLAALTAAGYDDQAPTAWLVEGLLVYLDTDDARSVLSTITVASPPGSRLAFERGAKTRDVTATDTAAVTTLWRGGVGDDVEHWLVGMGWSVSVDNLGDVAAGYGRPMSRRTDSGFVRATR